MSSLADLIDFKRAELVDDAVAALPDATYSALALSEYTLDGCMRAVTKALRTKNPREIQRWLDYEIQTPAPEDLLACLDIAIDQIKCEMQAGRNSKLTRTLRFLDWVRSEAARHLDATSPKKVPYMVSEDAIVIVDGLVQVMSVHEPEIATHLDATAELAARTAAAMGLDDETAVRCRLAGRLHDLGDIAIDPQILRKAGSLHGTETAIMLKHAEKGAAVIAAIPLLAELAPIVHAHHERIDGGGYPDRLVGDEIPIESRIIAVADAFHAMTVEHAYRGAIAVDRALAELTANAGTQFDENVVQAFIGLFGYSRCDLRGIA